MNVMAFTGFLGSGKTAGASVFAKAYQQRSGCTLYSNYGLQGAKMFSKLDDFKDIARQPSSILVLDEAHMDFDARSFSSNHVKFFTQVSYYLRKMRCTLILTTPNFGDIDSRIRGITNILVQVTKRNGYFYYDMFDLQSDRFLKTMRFRVENLEHYGEQIFDTTKMVTPIEIPDKKGDFKDFLDELKLISENYSVSAARQSPLAVGV
ncbi:hypothetical protein KH263_19765 (plasmid) [Bacillus velezensis]|uniref:zonular occludens toxin domain-containing protein n=1 Tax=Bacillus velezensis TaxID=492670 RepID=UPI001BD16D3E|nr:zonular occludens toxin domain-containing protein [Bacillus velezensis]QVL41472.1 hypothetical protein KH263_19765 [Bacillus velezensis]